MVGVGDDWWQFPELRQLGMILIITDVRADVLDNIVLNQRNLGEGTK
jgi:hypothetical protein